MKLKRWIRPDDKAKWRNSLASAVNNAPGGTHIIYLEAPAFTPGTADILDAAARVAKLTKCPLVQWPMGPREDAHRKWAFAIQKPTQRIQG